eukprot:2863331-Ditylum_brightwellii.AAC.1
MYNVTSRSRQGIALLDMAADSWNLDRSTVDGSVGFIFPSLYEDDAIHHIKRLGQYLAKDYDEGVKQYFTMDQATRISNSKIDPVSGKVIFWEDELVMEEENDNDTPDW